MTVEKKHSPRCFLDIEIDGEKAGRIIVELFAEVCPITCENFRALCTGEKGIGKTTNKPLHYKDAPFHRVVKNFVIQGGDFVAGNGTGGESIYGGQFKDENFTLSHDKPFLLSMSNRGKDSNGSQFFIITQAAPHLNGKHTVFGQVLDGHEVVTKIESIKTDTNCRPTKEVKISNCGELVLKIKQKERKPKVSESEESEIEDAREKLKKKKKHKHSKKHKKDKREDKDTDVPLKKDEDESGCMVDPEEIPTVPANNFLMRRTSPMGDGNRRPQPREKFNYHRPSRSRSGRKIKGRGFMRYRTPSRSTSRSGSETPPHWKQAQSRLKNIKDVVLPPKEAFGAEESESEREEMDENTHKSGVMQSRLGLVSKSNMDFKQKDARMIMRENRRNREWSPESSPPKEKSGRNWSALQSTVVVTSNFTKDSEDRWQDQSNYRKGGRRGSPERWNTRDRFGGDRFSDRPDNRRQGPDNRGPPNWRGGSPRRHDHFKNRRNQSSDEEAANKDRPRKTEPIRVKDKKAVKSLTSDLFRYRKDIQESSEEQSDKEEEPKPKKKEEPKEPEKKAKTKLFSSLTSDLFRYRKDAVESDSGSEDQNAQKSDGRITPKPVDEGHEPRTASRFEEKENRDEPEKKSKSKMFSDLFRYHKGMSDSESDSEDQSKAKSGAKDNQQSLPSLNSVLEGIRAPSLERSPKRPDTLGGILQGITEESTNGMSPPNQHGESVPMDIDISVEQASEKESLYLNSRGKNEEPLAPGTVDLYPEPKTPPPPVKEKRRWDMQESDTRSKKPADLPSFESVTSFDYALPDAIPLPEETQFKVTGEKAGLVDAAQETAKHAADILHIRSKSPQSENESHSPVKSASPIRQTEEPPPPGTQHSSSTAARKRSRSKSPRPSLSSPPRNRSKSPVKRRASESSPEPRRRSPAKKSRDSSRSPRRTRPRRSRSRDRLRRRSRSRSRPRRFGGRYGGRGSPPDRRPPFPRRYGSGRGRSRSRSAERRRHPRRGRRSSSSSGSSSSSRSRKKERRGKRSSSSSSRSSRSP